jgi:hypothetical protein
MFAPFLVAMSLRVASPLSLHHDEGCKLPANLTGVLESTPTGNRKQAEKWDGKKTEQK